VSNRPTSIDELRADELGADEHRADELRPTSFLLGELPARRDVNPTNITR
jgi:hypothetical protein